MHNRGTSPELGSKFIDRARIDNQHKLIRKLHSMGVAKTVGETFPGAPFPGTSTKADLAKTTPEGHWRFYVLASLGDNSITIEGADSSHDIPARRVAINLRDDHLSVIDTDFSETVRPGSKVNGRRLRQALEEAGSAKLNIDFVNYADLTA